MGSQLKDEEVCNKWGDSISYGFGKDDSKLFCRSIPITRSQDARTDNAGGGWFVVGLLAKTTCNCRSTTESFENPSFGANIQEEDPNETEYHHFFIQIVSKSFQTDFRRFTKRFQTISNIATAFYCNWGRQQGSGNGVCWTRQWRDCADLGNSMDTSGICEAGS